MTPAWRSGGLLAGAADLDGRIQGRSDTARRAQQTGRPDTSGALGLANGGEECPLSLNLLNNSRPVTPEAAGSSPVARAIPWVSHRRNPHAAWRRDAISPLDTFF